MAFRDFRRALLALATIAAVAGSTCAPSVAAPDPSSIVGIWTLGSNTSVNQCRMVLRTDVSGKGMALSLPPACRRAAPTLQKVRAWSYPDEGLLSLDDDRGQQVAAFIQQTNGAFQATDAGGQMLTMERLAQGEAADANKKGGSLVTLNPAAAGFEKKTAGGLAVPAAATGAEAVAAPARAAPPKPMTPAEVAGNYAVLRGDRDTGCMVVLDPGARGAKMKARLAPACRDGGITVFDPLGWDLKAGAIVLTARKGHTITLQQNEKGLWVKMPEDVKALGLKRL